MSPPGRPKGEYRSAQHEGISMTRTVDLPELIGRCIRQDVQSMHGYAVQPSAGFIKLDAMENPFRLPEPLRRELGERLGEVAINRYPGSITGCDWSGLTNLFAD